MIFNILIILLLIFFIILLHSRKGLNLIVYIYIFSFILAGGLNKTRFLYILEPADWLTVILLAAFFLYCSTKKRDYLFKITWADKFFFIYLIFIVVFPLIIHFKQDFTPEQLVNHFIPIRLWVVYRVFFYLQSEAAQRKYYKLNIDYFIRVFIFAGFVSALIAITRYLPYNIPFIKDFINETWPLPREGWFRLWGTNGGTNAAGNLFAVMILFSYEYLPGREYCLNVPAVFKVSF